MASLLFSHASCRCAYDVPPRVGKPFETVRRRQFYPADGWDGDAYPNSEIAIWSFWLPSTLPEHQGSL